MSSIESAPRRRWPTPGVSAAAESPTWSVRFPLHAAACSADSSSLRALLKSADPLDINATDDEGRSALHYAAWNGLADPVSVLLDAGADANVRSSDRASTPAHFAAGMSHPACLRLLIEKGANLELRDADKWTPLDLARQDLMKLGRCSRRDDVEELLTAVTRKPATGRVCGSCAAAALYNCPRCNAAYCKAACYALHGSACTEPFFRRQVQGEEAMRDTDTVLRRKTLGVLLSAATATAADGVLTLHAAMKTVRRGVRMKPMTAAKCPLLTQPLQLSCVNSLWSSTLPRLRTTHRVSSKF